MNFYRNIFFILWLVPSLFFGQVNLTGKVIDAHSGESIPAAVLHVEKLNYYLTTDNDGNFKIEGLDSAKYTIHISHIAYASEHYQVDLTSGKAERVIFQLSPKAVEISQVVITGEHSHSKLEELSASSNKLQGRRLEKNLGLTLASTLKNEAGLAMRSMGPAPARPVIRGLSGDRVMIAEDGSKSVDLSSTSPDHAVTIDPFNLESIEVIRGPKLLLNSSTTIGGMVNIVKHEIPVDPHDEVYLTLGGYGESSNKGYLGSVITEIPIDNFILKGELSRRKTNDLNTPIGSLENSYSENLNYGGGVSYIYKDGYSGIAFKKFELDYGIPGGFIGAHPNGVDIAINKHRINFSSKYNFGDTFIESIKLDISRDYYRHKEFEANGAIGSEFRITHYNGRATINHNELSVFDNGTFRFNGELRDFNIGGFVFTSPAKLYNFSFALFENISLERINIELGARVNFDKIEPERQNHQSDIGLIRTRNFETFSLSGSFLYSLSDIVYIGANISRSSRIPTIEELYSEGPHLAAYSYEVGNPNLNAETGIGTEFFIYHQFDKLNFNLNIFYNDLNNFIVPRKTGEINYQTFLPVYQTSGIGARFYGTDGRIEWKISQVYSLTLSASYTIGKFKEVGNNLPQIPPLKGFAGIQYTRDNFIFSINTEMAAAQNNVDQFEEPTVGYIILNASAQYSINTRLAVHNFTFNIDNLLNKEYRNHLSRVKSVLPEAGRNFRLTYKLYFHF
ncbi:MAG: TonB-dependent receptor [Melioribacteraceae bacterium]|nr:TonB-dependent receptor [Melioribacteraceae bacterium]